MRSPLTTPTADLVTPGPDGHAIEDSILQALATGETCTVTLDRSQPGPWEVSCSSGAYRYAIRIERYTSPVYAQQAAASHMPAYAEQTTFHGYPAATWADREFMQDHLWQAGHWVIKTWVYDDTFSHPSAVDYSEQLYTLAQQYHLFP